MDNNICMQYGSKRKGEALDVVSLECGKKEKRVKRKLLLSDSSLSMGSVEAAG